MEEMAINSTASSGNKMDIIEVRGVEETWCTDANQLAMQLAVSHILLESQTVGEGCHRVLEAVCTHLHWNRGELWIIDPKIKILRCGEIWEDATAQFEEFDSATREVGRAIDEGFVGQVWAKGEVISIADVSQEPGFPRVASAAKVGLRGALAFPIRRGSQIIGVMAFFSRQPQPADDYLMSVFAALADQIELFIERTEGEETLHQTTQTLQALVNAAPLAIVSVDRHGRVSSWNQRAEQIFGWTANEVMGEEYALVPENKHDEFQSELRAVVENKKKRGFETQRRKKDGSLIDVNISTAPLFDARGNVTGAMAILEDVTQRKRAEETLLESQARLRMVSRELINAQESERRRIARELHDEIGQAITVLKISLHSVKCSKQSAPRLNESLKIIDQLMQQVRNLSVDLRPPVLDDLGLVAALRSHLKRQAHAAGFGMRFVADDLKPRLSVEMETACFRIVQEIVTNIVRHAHPQNVEVALRKRPGELELMIADDGIGFDVAGALKRATEGESLGLLSMKERVSLLGGRFEIASDPGAGTKILMHFPL